MTRTVRIGIFATVLTCLVAASTAAQENTTLLMRSGQRLSAQLIDMGGVGFNVVVNGEERQIPVSDVAAIEFAGAAAPAPADAARKPADGRHTVWLRNGDVIEGQLYDIDGVRPLHIIVKTEDGEIRLSSSEVLRIVLAPAAELVGTRGNVWTR